MLHPSYSELMDTINKINEEKNVPDITSRYSIVIAASKRARHLIDGQEQLVEMKNTKPLSVAVEELKEGKMYLKAKGVNVEDELVIKTNEEEITSEIE